MYTEYDVPHGGKMGDDGTRADGRADIVYINGNNVYVWEVKKVTAPTESQGPAVVPSPVPNANPDYLGQPNWALTSNQKLFLFTSVLVVFAAILYGLSNILSGGSD